MGEHLSPLQWEEAVVPGCGSRARGQGRANEALPFWWQCGITLAQKDG